MQAIKCMLVGDSKVGKTDLFLTFTTGCPASGYSPTVFDIFTKQVVVEDASYNLALWDSSGDCLYDEIRPISYPHTDCFLICYSVDDRTSFENVEAKWKPEILRFGDGPTVPLILAGLKSDLRPKEATKNVSTFLTKEEGEALQKRIGARQFFECSTISENNVDLILQNMIQSAMVKKAGEETPKNPLWGFEDLKILLVGDSTTGKSSILNAYMTQKPMKDGHDPTTEGVQPYQDTAYSILVLDGIEYFLGIFDVPSTPEFLHDRIKEYQKANGIILCYAVNDPFSFHNLENQWIPEIRKYCPTVPLIIIGNKCDLKTDTEILIPTEDGEELMRSMKAVAFVECSAKTLENIRNVFITGVKAFRKSIPPKDSNGESDITNSAKTLDDLTKIEN